MKTFNSKEHFSKMVLCLSMISCCPLFGLGHPKEFPYGGTKIKVAYLNWRIDDAFGSTLKYDKDDYVEENKIIPT